jgi:hypothetical protein
VKATEYLIGDMKTMIPKNHFNDQTLACFFYELERLHEYKPHIKKSCLAAINFGLQIHQLENIHSFKHLYPDLTLILKPWDCQLKIAPIMCRKGKDVMLIQCL